jgi:hypothetical protein
VWWYLTPLYNHAVGALAAPVIRIDQRLFDIEAVPRDRVVQLRSVGGHFPPATIFVEQLTYNIVLFAALVATRKGAFRDRGMRRFALAVLILFVSHVLAFVCFAFSIYATSQGDWSDVYGPTETRIWQSAAYFLGIVGTLAMAFVGWIVVRGGLSGAPPPLAARTRRKAPPGAAALH